MHNIYEEMAVGSYVDYQRVVSVPIAGTRRSRVLRVKLHSDSSYQNQSTACVEVFTAERGWVEVHTPYPLTMSAAWNVLSPYNRDTQGRRMVALQTGSSLFDIALKILG